MMRLLIPILLVLAGATWFVLQPTRPIAITVTDAEAVPMNTQGGMYMVTLNLQNSGPAATLIEVTSPEAGSIGVMNTDPGPGTLVVPGEGAASLAMDGAHLMLSVDPGSVEEGGFVPVTLRFDGGTVSTRVRNVGLSDEGMDHSAGNGIEVTPKASVSLNATSEISAEGFQIALTLRNFDLVSVPEGTEHVSGEGHAHLYLNGLKLGRLYETSYALGGLVPGDYEFRVVLNSHDHRPYLSGGTLVEDRLRFSIP